MKCPKHPEENLMESSNGSSGYCMVCNDWYDFDDIIFAEDLKGGGEKWMKKEKNL